MTDFSKRHLRKLPNAGDIASTFYDKQCVGVRNGFARRLDTLSLAKPSRRRAVAQVTLLLSPGCGKYTWDLREG